MRCVNPWKISSDLRDEVTYYIATFEEIMKIAVAGLDGRGKDAFDAAYTELKLIFKAMD